MTSERYLITNKIDESGAHKLNVILTAKHITGNLVQQDVQKITAIFSEELHPSIGFSKQVLEIIAALRLKNKPAITVVSATENFQLVPKSLFMEEEVKRYLPLEANPIHVISESLDVANQDLVTCYEIAPYLSTQLVQDQAEVQWKHISTLMISRCLQKAESKTLQIFAHLEPGQLFVTILSHNKLKFYNQFQIEQPADFLYYLLGIYETQSISFDSAKLWLSGELNVDDEYHLLAHNYFGKVQLLRDADALEGALGEQRTHRFALLSNPHL